METNIQNNTPIITTNVLCRVTPVSKYLAMILFVLMPFIGGWIGYAYAPEKVVEVERVIVREVVKTVIQDEKEMVESVEEAVALTDDIEWPIISMNAMKPGDLACSHKHLNLITSESYANWPSYVESEYGITFSYPPHQIPNVEEGFTYPDGRSGLRIGYNPNLDPTSMTPAREYLHDINDTWEVEVYTGGFDDTLINNDYCEGGSWCLLENLDFNVDFDTYVSSYELVGMLDPEVRSYYMYSDTGLVINLGLPAATGRAGSACDVISEVYNLDMIAHSLRISQDSF
jgi:hypothetical protein